MEDLRHSCHRYNVYPRNLVKQNLSLQRRDAYLDRLRREEDHLFEKGPAKVNVLDISNDDEGFERTIIASMEDVKGLLPIAPERKFDGRDSRCRFLFIHAAHSRAPLRISRDILTFICSYYQIPPSFLDFIFPFGAKEHDSHNDVCALRNESRLYARQRGLEIPLLGRSGYDIRLSYHLQSVERSPSEMLLPWSIRQTAVYHSYDVFTKQALWMNVKGNQLLDNTIDAEPMLSNHWNHSNGSAGSPFSTTLATHTTFAEWAAQNWRTYINELEELIFRRTERTIFIPVNRSPHSVESNSRSSTVDSNKKSRSSPTPANLASADTFPKQEQRRKPPEVPSGTEKTTTVSSISSEESRFLDDFSFVDLQDVQYMEEKMEEIITVLSLNATTLRDLRDLYRSLFARNEPPPNITANDVDIFEGQIIVIEKDMDRQGGRATTLLRKLQERKSLLSNILAYRSMKASEYFALRAQESTNSMEKLTKSMHTIAVATKKETVSMRIITLVTLFFLPGTFVATFMSTDVLRWTDDHRQFVPEALSTYFAISLPLMTLTFSAWFFMSKYSERKDAIMSARTLFGMA